MSESTTAVNNHGELQTDFQAGAPITVGTHLASLGTLNDGESEAHLSGFNVLDIASGSGTVASSLSGNFEGRGILSVLSKTIVRKYEYSPRVARSFVTIQEWEGFVDQIDLEARTYTVQLRPIRGINSDKVSQFTEEAEFDLDELTPVDRARVQLGVMLRWTIGYDYYGRTRQHGHRISFLR